ncbi:helix-turn-helix transcriptional regulator [Anaerofustis stercorihominis]|uniref:helix-turn-helix transcriptional regulator n=1 Tax=Anaerofustis stercorihominis TaxID=214853 RepID=UPI001485980D|nr:WYL domain-containing protein [Anaerofustis stercorihominis]
MKNNRYRIFLILKLLYEKSDEENPLTTKDIFSYLKEHNINIDRKTFNEDISFLSEVMGYDIICEKGNKNIYFFGERLFELPELAMLIDAVSSSQFISKKKSKIIINKLMMLVSENQRRHLNRNIINTGKVKTNNNLIYYIIDLINTAINKNKKISFRYYDYNINKDKIFKNNGEVYILSPYTLYWNQDKYYLVGYSDKRNDVVSFRVDRMEIPTMLDDERTKFPDGFSITDYGKKIFSMFPGEEKEVILKCKNELMKYIIDKFGEVVPVLEKGKEDFLVKVRVGLSPTFYAWIFQFEGGIKIVSPQNVIDDFNKMLNQNYIGENFTK